MEAWGGRITSVRLRCFKRAETPTYLFAAGLGLATLLMQNTLPSPVPRRSGPAPTEAPPTAAAEFNLGAFARQDFVNFRGNDFFYI